MRKLTYSNPIGGSVLFYGSPLLITSLKGMDIPPQTIQEQKAPFQDGSTPIDRLLNIREVVLDGAINAPNNFTAIASYRRSIISALNPKAGPGSFVYQNDVASYLVKNVIPEGPLFPDKILTDPFQSFQLTLYCHDPFLYDVSPTVVALGASTAVINSGDVMAPITLTISGACTNPIITNATSGYAIKYNGSLLAGQSLVISTTFGNKSVLLNGVNAMPNITNDTVFWGLLLGSNTITFSAGSGTPTVSLSFSNRYIGA